MMDDYTKETLECIYFLWRKLFLFAEDVACYAVAGIAFVTSPLWILPYAIIRKRRQKDGKQ